MKKTMLAGLSMLALVLMASTQTWAASEGTINVTVSLSAEISVSLDTTTWAIGSIALNSTNGSAPFTATVGNTATKLEIKGANGAGGWTIGTPPAADTFEISVADPAISLTADYQVLAASVAAYGNKAFALTYKAPTSDTKGGGVAQGFAITVKASAP